MKPLWQKSLRIFLKLFCEFDSFVYSSQQVIDIIRTPPGGSTSNSDTNHTNIKYAPILKFSEAVSQKRVLFSFTEDYTAFSCHFCVALSWPTEDMLSTKLICYWLLWQAFNFLCWSEKITRHLCMSKGKVGPPQPHKDWHFSLFCMCMFHVSCNVQTFITLQLQITLKTWLPGVSWSYHQSGPPAPEV